MKIYLIAAMVAAFASPSAFALTVDETDVRFVDFDPVELSATLSFDGYQGSGTVSAVMVEYFGEIDGTIGVVNTGSDAANFSATATSDFFYSSGDVTVPGAPQVTASGGTAGTVSLAAGESSTLPVAADDTLSDTVTGGAIAPFLSPFEIDVDTLTGISTISTIGGLEFLNITQLSAFGRVTVEYRIDDEVPDVPLPDDDVSVIPLPAAAWMLLAGIASLLTFRRFNKA